MKKIITLLILISSFLGFSQEVFKNQLQLKNIPEGSKKDSLMLIDNTGLVFHIPISSITYTAGIGLELIGNKFNNTITNNNQLINGANYITANDIPSDSFTIDYKNQVEENTNNRHAHSNKDLLDYIEEDINGEITYKGVSIKYGKNAIINKYKEETIPYSDKGFTGEESLFRVYNNTLYKFNYGSLWYSPFNHYDSYTTTSVLDSSKWEEVISVPTSNSQIANDEGYLKTSDISNKVDKVFGKDLSSNDFTDDLKNKLTDLTVINNNNQLINGAGYITNANISNKVDKIAGKGLSTNDYTDAEKHTNKVVLDKFGEDSQGEPTYNGNTIDTTIAQRDVYDGLDSNDNTISLSAKQGKILNDKFANYALSTSLNGVAKTNSNNTFLTPNIFNGKVTFNSITEGIDYGDLDNTPNLSNYISRSSDYSNNLVIDPNSSNTGIAGSIFTIKNNSTDAATNVTHFLDVNRNNTANTTAQTYGGVFRVINNSSFNNEGIVGANLVGRHSGSGDSNYTYGSRITSENIGSGQINFLTGNLVESLAKGSGNVTSLRGLSVHSEVNNSSTIIDNLQSAHFTNSLQQGTVNSSQVVLLDFDYSGTGTITGDFSYLRIQNDPLPSIGGNSYAINSLTNLPSKFSGNLTINEKFRIEDDGNSKIEFYDTVENTTGILSYNGNSEEFTFNSDIVASSIRKIGGTSSQFLKADGSIDNNSYVQDAPSDNQTYARKNGNWVVTAGSGGSGSAIEYTAGTGLALNGTEFSNTITNNNQLINGAGYITSSSLSNKVNINSGGYGTYFDGTYLQFNGTSSSGNYISFNNSSNSFYFNSNTSKQNTSANAKVYAQSFYGDGSNLTGLSIPTNNNELTNGAGYINNSSNESIAGSKTFTGYAYIDKTSSEINSAPVSTLLVNKGYVNDYYAKKDDVFNKDYNNLLNAPNIPTNNNQLTNGAGYITSDTSLGASADWIALNLQGTTTGNLYYKRFNGFIHFYGKITTTVNNAFNIISSLVLGLDSGSPYQTLNSGRILNCINISDRSVASLRWTSDGKLYLNSQANKSYVIDALLFL